MNWGDLDNIFKGVDFDSLPKLHSDRATAWGNVYPELLADLMFSRLETAFYGINKVSPELQKKIKQAVVMSYSSANVDSTETNHPTFKEFIKHTIVIRWDYSGFYDKEFNRQRLQYLTHGNLLEKTVDEEITDLYRQLKQYEIFRDDLNMLAKVKSDILDLATESPDFSKYLTASEAEKVLSIKIKQEYPKVDRVKVEHYQETSDKEILLNYLRSLLKYYQGAEDDLPEIPLYKNLLKKLSQHLSH